MEWAELYGYDDEDDPPDYERLTVIDDYYFRIATDWQQDDTLDLDCG